MAMNRSLGLLLHEMVIAAINNDVSVDITIDDIERSHFLGSKDTNSILRSTQERPTPIIF